MKISAGHLGVVMSLVLAAVGATGCASQQAPKTPTEVLTATHTELAHTIEPAAVEEWRSVSALLEPGLDAKLMDTANPYEAKSLDVATKDGLVPVRTWGSSIPAKVIAPALPEMLDARE
jgi:hypothetical protein